MPVTIITENIEGRSGDIIIEMINLPKRVYAFSEYIENEIIKNNNGFYMGIEFRNSRLSCYLTDLWEKKYKFAGHILSENKQSDFKHRDYIDACACIFRYMACEKFENVMISLEQYRDFVGEKEFDISYFIETMVDESFYHDINIGIVVESEEIKEDIINLVLNINKEYVQEVNNDIVIYDKCTIDCEKKDRENNIINSFELNKYMEGGKQKTQFRKQLLDYIVRKGLPESRIAELANMYKGTLNKIKNGKRLSTRNCVLGLGIVLGLNIKEFTDFMQAAGFCFPKEDKSLEGQRDFIIKFLIERNCTRNIVEINELLDARGLELLGENKSK